MLSDDEVFENMHALSDAVVSIGGGKIGSMVVHAVIPISLKKGETILLRKNPTNVRFIHDKNQPKFFVDSFDKMNFHTEFSPGWQRFRYLSEKRILVVSGTSGQAPQGYALRLHLKGVKATRDA